MGKNKKHNPEGITSSVGGCFTPKRKKKGLGPLTPAREAVRKEIREIVHQAKEEKEALKRKVSTAAKSGIKGLKVDSARLLNMLKDLKFKDDSSSAKESQKNYEKIHEPIKQIHTPIFINGKEVSYYDTWYYIIESELKSVKKNLK